MVRKVETKIREKSPLTLCSPPSSGQTVIFSSGRTPSSYKVFVFVSHYPKPNNRRSGRAVKNTLNTTRRPDAISKGRRHAHRAMFKRRPLGQFSNGRRAESVGIWTAGKRAQSWFSTIARRRSNPSDFGGVASMDANRRIISARAFSLRRRKGIVSFPRRRDRKQTPGDRPFKRTLSRG